MAAGIFLGLAYPPVSWYSGAWVAIGVLHAASGRVNAGPKRYATLLIGYLAAWTVAFPWPWRHPELEGAVAGTAVWILLAMLYAGAGELSMRLRRPFRAAAAVAFYLSLEAFLRYGPAPMPWPTLGHTQADAGFLFGVAAAWGVEGLSAALLISNALVWEALARTPHSPLRRLSRAGGFVLVAAAVPAVISLVPLTPTSESGSVDVAIFQPGLGPMAWGYDDGRRMRRIIASGDGHLGDQPAGVVPESSPVALAIFPESSLRSGDPDWTRDAARLYARWGIPVLLGSVIDFGEFRTNSAVLADSNGVTRYDKRRLVPFVESVPLEHRLPLLGGLRLDSRAIRPGDGRLTLGPDSLSMGLAICFETLFPDHARAGVRAGADVLVALSQSGWWRSERAARQHLAFSRFRALETGRSLVISTVNGVSAVVNADGSYAWTGPWNEAAVARARVRLHAGPARYGGDRIWLPAVILSGLLLIIGRPRTHSTEEPSRP
jgi:apolipoprotein N-acyltransferase